MTNYCDDEDKDFGYDDEYVGADDGDGDEL